MTKVAGKRDLAMILGTAFAAGVAAHNLTKPDAAYVARMTAVHALQDLEEQGRRVESWDCSQRDAIPERAAKAVEKYIAHNPIPAEWRILQVETLLPSGVARPDLVVDDGRGPTPLDYKFKLSLKREYEEREVSRWRMSWQMLHYCWEIQGQASRDAEKRPGAVSTEVTDGTRMQDRDKTLLSRSLTPDYHYYICLVVAEPFRVQLYPFEVYPQTMDWWEQSARRYWQRMAQCEGDDEMASRHADEYGECEYAGACFGHHLDRERMMADYIQLPRRVH